LGRRALTIAREGDLRRGEEVAPVRAHRQRLQALVRTRFAEAGRKGDLAPVPAAAVHLEHARALFTADDEPVGEEHEPLEVERSVDVDRDGWPEFPAAELRVGDERDDARATVLDGPEHALVRVPREAGELPAARIVRRQIEVRPYFHEGRRRGLLAR